MWTRGHADFCHQGNLGVHSLVHAHQLWSAALSADTNLEYICTYSGVRVYLLWGARVLTLGCMCTYSGVRVYLLWGAHGADASAGFARSVPCLRCGVRLVRLCKTNSEKQRSVMESGNSIWLDSQPADFKRKSQFGWVVFLFPATVKVGATC